MAARRLSFFLLALVPWAVAQGSRQCYYPDGFQGDPRLQNWYAYIPCGGQNTTFKSCCVQGRDTCLPNGLCSSQGQYDYRGACENQDWSGCQKVCLDVQSSSWVEVKQCSFGQYCCNPSGDCCSDGSRRFPLETRVPISSTTLISTTTTLPTASTTTTAASSPPSSNAAVIGGAVGGSLGGVAVLGAILGVFLCLRRRKPTAQPADQPPAQQYIPYKHYNPSASPAWSRSQNTSTSPLGSTAVPHLSPSSASPVASDTRSSPSHTVSIMQPVKPTRMTSELAGEGISELGTTNRHHETNLGDA